MTADPAPRTPESDFVHLLLDETISISELKMRAFSFLEDAGIVEPRPPVGSKTVEVYTGEKYKTGPNKGKKKYKIENANYIRYFRRAVVGCMMYYRTKKKPPTITEYREFDSRIPYEVMQRLYQDPKFVEAMEAVGVISIGQNDVATVGLSEKQVLALALLTNFADRRSLAQKLKAVGATNSEYQTWLSNPSFAAIYRKQAEDLLNQAQPVVNTALVQLATGVNDPGNKADLNAIKYLMEVNGRWDPQSRSQMDVRIVLTRIVEIITSEVTDPDTLRRIGAKMAVLSGSMGMTVEGAATTPAFEIG